MICTNSENVFAAFDALLEEIEVALRDINNAGAYGSGTQDYEMAQSALEYARSARAFCENVSLLKKEWQKLDIVFQTSMSEETPKAIVVNPPTRTRSLSSLSNAPTLSEIPTPIERLIVGRIRKGLRTPEPAFFLPILQALVDLGGSAKRQEVYDLLAQSMIGILKPIDFLPLASEARQLRWQNSAQWAHNLLVKEGLLQMDSPNGIWEITEKGRTFLTEKKHGGQ
ncbi:MAG: winged helix-turn-helix domain-containing protein [Chloroflexota bacterium]|nr:winged helix-turn-helix domain-containing protein [Chloroflexota bacterium]